MYKHIVMMDIRPEVPESERAGVPRIIYETLNPLVGKIEGLLSVEVGGNLIPGGKDICLCMEFATREALESYQPHPLHQEASKKTTPLLTGRVACDYEVSENRY